MSDTSDIVWDVRATVKTSYSPYSKCGNAAGFVLDECAKCRDDPKSDVVGDFSVCMESSFSRPHVLRRWNISRPEPRARIGNVPEYDGDGLWW